MDTNQYELVITVGYKTDGETPAAGSGTVKYYYSSSDSALPSDSSVLAASAQTMSAVANSTGDYSVTLESTARNNWFVNIIVFVDGTADITYVPANFVVTATLQVKGA